MKGEILKTQEGFTLVELMVVVAIIGILSAVAIPNFKTYQSRSRSSEARLQLSSIYTNQLAFAADYDNYRTCLGDMGYDPGEAASRYYAVGFETALPAADNNVNGSVCDNGVDFQFDGGRETSGDSADAPTYLTGGSTVTDGGSQFLAEATGIISSDFRTAANADQWTIDERKTITHVRRGY